jgi:cytochrome c peroxidase
MVLLLLLAVGWMEACKKSGGASNAPHPMTFTIPPGFPQPVYQFQDNPPTEEGFALGRKLFYDGRLSRNGQFPCASCHQQFAAFSTFDHDLSHGFNNQFTLRNAPGLFNLTWMDQLHWDGGIRNLEVQPLAPITAPNEMAEDLDRVLDKLRADEKYPSMFAAAFGDPEINSQRMLKAIAQFTGMMVSANAKYDRVKRGETQFTEAEEKGYEIFKAKCNSCHKEPLFTDFSYRNTGIPLNPYLKDVGRMRITGLSSDSLKFKVPSLRNVQLTAPYGHDGRFYAIRSMLDHYSSGVVNAPGTDPLVRNGIPLDDYDKYYLLQFLYSLTDSSFVKDPRFAAPE